MVLSHETLDNNIQVEQPDHQEKLIQDLEEEEKEIEAQIEAELRNSVDNGLDEVEVTPQTTPVIKIENENDEARPEVMVLEVATENNSEEATLQEEKSVTEGNNVAETEPAVLENANELEEALDLTAPEPVNQDILIQTPSPIQMGTEEANPVIIETRTDTPVSPTTFNATQEIPPVSEIMSQSPQEVQIEESVLSTVDSTLADSYIPETRRDTNVSTLADETMIQNENQTATATAFSHTETHSMVSLGNSNLMTESQSSINTQETQEQLPEVKTEPEKEQETTPEPVQEAVEKPVPQPEPTPTVEVNSSTSTPHKTTTAESSTSNIPDNHELNGSMLDTDTTVVSDLPETQGVSLNVSNVSKKEDKRSPTPDKKILNIDDVGKAQDRIEQKIGGGFWGIGQTNSWPETRSMADP